MISNDVAVKIVHRNDSCGAYGFTFDEVLPYWYSYYVAVPMQNRRSKSQDVIRLECGDSVACDNVVSFIASR